MKNLRIEATPSAAVGLILLALVECGCKPTAGPDAGCVATESTDPCSLASCDAEGNPVLTPLPDGFILPAELQQGGDCLTAICVGGSTCSTPDDADIPNDGNSCTIEICSAGLLTIERAPVDTTCGSNLRCDSLGRCVECNLKQDCPQPPRCQEYRCVDHVCVLTPGAVDGGPSTCDGNLCMTSHYCIDGVCAPRGFRFCDNPSPCSGYVTCRPQTGECDLLQPRPDGGACDDLDPCTQIDHCENGRCAGTPVTCLPTGQCQVNGSCQADAGGCVFAPADAGTPCSEDGGTACDGLGACR